MQMMIGFHELSLDFLFESTRVFGRIIFLDWSIIAISHVGTHDLKLPVHFECNKTYSAEAHSSQQKEYEHKRKHAATLRLLRLVSFHEIVGFFYFVFHHRIFDKKVK